MDDHGATPEYTQTLYLRQRFHQDILDRACHVFGVSARQIAEQDRDGLKNLAGQVVEFLGRTLTVELANPDEEGRAMQRI